MRDLAVEAYARSLVEAAGQWDVHQNAECPVDCQQPGCRRARAIELLFRLEHDGKQLALPTDNIQVGILDALSLAFFDDSNPSPFAQSTQRYQLSPH